MRQYLHLVPKMKNYQKLAKYDCTPLSLVQLFETQPPLGRGWISFARQFVREPQLANIELLRNVWSYNVLCMI